jgi:hypothetical protein
MSAETQMVNNLAMVVDPNRRKSFLRAAFDKSQKSERRQAADKEGVCLVDVLPAILHLCCSMLPLLLMMLRLLLLDATSVAA